MLVRSEDVVHDHECDLRVNYNITQWSCLDFDTWSNWQIVVGIGNLGVVTCIICHVSYFLSYSLYDPVSSFQSHVGVYQNQKPDVIWLTLGCWSPIQNTSWVQSVIRKKNRASQFPMTIPSPIYGEIINLKFMVMGSFIRTGRNQAVLCSQKEEMSMNRCPSYVINHFWLHSVRWVII